MDYYVIIFIGMQKSLLVNEQKIYDVIVCWFIVVFYFDCIVFNIVVIGELVGVSFKVKGKEILEEGWRVLYLKLILLK